MAGRTLWAEAIDRPPRSGVLLTLTLRSARRYEAGVRVGDKLLSVNGELCAPRSKGGGHPACVAGLLHASLAGHPVQASCGGADVMTPSLSGCCLSSHAPGCPVRSPYTARATQREKALWYGLSSVHRAGLCSRHRCTSPAETASMLREAEGAPRLSSCALGTPNYQSYQGD